VTKYVIIGNSAGAIGAVEAIRKNDLQGEITIISHEKFHTYSRPLISYLLLGKTTEEKMKYRGDSFYEDNKCKLMLSKKVLKINSKEKEIVLDDNTKIAYDKLLVSTGSTPFVPPMSGLEKVTKKFTFISLEDAQNLDKVINQDSNVLILGAGLIGLKCAEGITDKVKSVTVVDLAPKVLSSILDEDASIHIKKFLEEKGLTFYLENSVKNFPKDGVATLTNGKEIKFDALVIAVGVRPNIELIKDAEGKTARGIVVNDKCETSIADIYAAGDCTECMDVSSGDNKVMALLPNAYMQGECAGTNMAGGDMKFDKALPMNAIGFFGYHIVSAGNYVGESFLEDDGYNYKRLYYSNNLLNGFILLGNVQKAGIYTSIIREKIPLDSIDFSLVCKKPGLIAFSKDERQKKLGGVPK
jgi:NAD(P)H-nitrite reductase large subunit